MKDAPKKENPAFEEYPAVTDSNAMARDARTAVNKMSEEEVEANFSAAMARIYGGRSAQQAPVAGH